LFLLGLFELPQSSLEAALLSRSVSRPHYWVLSTILVNIDNMLGRMPYQKCGAIKLVRSMSRSPIKPEAIRKGSDIHEFLVRELPPENAKHASYFANALREAGERYDRYIATRDEWFDYAKRRNKLERITTSIEGAASGLSELDILSRDDLASRVDQKQIDELIGSLRRLSKETAALVNQAQSNGRPRDLAEERWIFELADIYENAFHRPAAVWGSGDGPIKGCGSFFRFLELNRPKSFPRHGKLHLRQVARLLERRHPPPLLLAGLFRRRY
jgi:hypothetical protein